VDIKTIPLNTLKMTLDTAKGNENTGDKHADALMKQFNITLDSLYKGANQIAKKMGVNKVPLIQIKLGIDIVKDAYIKELKNA
jgi:hypothetical protein